MLNALQGLKILDLTRLLPGPFATMILADFGADVIKIEAPTTGDYGRWVEPHVGNDTNGRHMILNRNKRSLTLNLKNEEGKTIFRDLVKDTDVVVEGFRPGVMDRLSLGYASLKQLNPRLIYCAVTGYGQTGPYRSVAGHDLNYLAMAGVLYETGKPNEVPPVPGIQLSDIGGGAMTALSGILIALLSRFHTGQGQFVDISMMDGAFSYLVTHFAHTMAGVAHIRGQEAVNGGRACYSVYETKDRQYMALAAFEEKFWANFCEVIGRPDLVSKHAAPYPQQVETMKEIQGIFWTKTRLEWTDIFSKTDACCSPVLSPEEAIHHPQIKQRNLVLSTDEGDIAPFQLGFPIALSDTPASIQRRAPELGEHTKQILGELGYSEEHIADLQRRGVI